jgi:hypothetical protein
MIRPMSGMAKSCGKSACCIACVTECSGWPFIARKTVCVRCVRQQLHEKLVGTTITYGIVWQAVLML